MATTADIHVARRESLAADPYNPNKNALPTFNKDGELIGMSTLPDFDDLDALSLRLGMEYLAICHDETELDAWIHRCIQISGSPQDAGLVFARVLRNMNLSIAAALRTDNDPQRRELFNAMAVEAWTKDFSQIGNADD